MKNIFPLTYYGLIGMKGYRDFGHGWSCPNNLPSLIAYMKGWSIAWKESKS